VGEEENFYYLAYAVFSALCLCFLCFKILGLCFFLEMWGFGVYFFWRCGGLGFIFCVFCVYVFCVLVFGDVFWVCVFVCVGCVACVFALFRSVCLSSPCQ